MDLKRIVEQGDTPLGRLFDSTILLLIIVSVLAFSISTIPGLNDRTLRVLERVQQLTLVVFTVEYVLRILVADRKLAYIFSFYGLIDLFAILPFYLPLWGLNLTSLRVLRILRLVSFFKVVRYSNAIERYRAAFLDIKEEMVLFLFVTMILLYVSAVGIYYFENPAQPEKFRSIFHSLWWAITTLTTVGYGDVYPVTVGGRIFTFLILLIGLTIVAVPAGLLASALMRVNGDEDEGQK